MSNSIEIFVATDFSRFPAGRFKTDGPNSGQRFREEFLKSNLEKKNKINVHLDNVLGYGSSFLEEAFGGLVREYGFTKDSLRSLMVLESSDDSIISEIWQYIDEESDRIQRSQKSE